MLPRLAIKVSDILERDTPNIDPVVAKIMGNLLVKRSVRRNENMFDVEIQLLNHTTTAQSLKIHDLISYRIKSAEPEPHMAVIGDKFDHLWAISLPAGGRASLTYTIEASEAGGEEVSLPVPIVEGVSAELVTGAKVIGHG